MVSFGPSVVAVYLGGASALIEQVGTFWSLIIALGAFFVLVLVLNFLAAPANIQRETDAEVERLRAQLDRRDLRDAATARLWELRAEGTQIRNEAVSSDDYGTWEAKYNGWNEKVLKEAETISKNLKAWLVTLDHVRPSPKDLPPPVNPQHHKWRQCLSEVLLRLEEFLQADMLHRDILSIN